jgi:very-short-patch-repair endonuclease
MAGLIDPAAGSPLESIFRVVLWSAGVPAPLSQYEVVDGLFMARVDFAWPDYRLIVELDGFAYHADRASYRNDRERGNQLERLRWRVLRFTWEDVMFRPDEVVALILAAIAG